MKQLLRAMIALTPYRIVRRAENRFDAFDYSLRLLKSYGFDPRLLIDGGAHLGSFTDLATRIFPTVIAHLIEPQNACHATLSAMAKRHGHHFHPYALGNPQDLASGLKLSESDEASTGAHITTDGQPIPVAILDDLVHIEPGDRALLKLDLQGFELRALQGATEALKGIEVVVTEVSFFAQAYEPSIIDIVAYLDTMGFDLFDIAALSGRTRDNRLRQGDFIFVKRGSSLSLDTSWA